MRKRLHQRLSSALLGIAIATLGSLIIATLSGYDPDLNLVLIWALVGAGALLVLAALLASFKPRGSRIAPAADAPEDLPSADSDTADAEPADLAQARERAQSAADA